MAQTITAAADREQPAAANPADPVGRAALLLVESLIHALIARASLSLGEAIEIVRIAIEAQDRPEDDLPSRQVSVASLVAIVASLEIDRDLAALVPRSHPLEQR